MSAMSGTVQHEGGRTWECEHCGYETARDEQPPGWVTAYGPDVQRRQVRHITCCSWRCLVAYAPVICPVGFADAG
jgi:hypothetical protein